MKRKWIDKFWDYVTVVAWLVAILSVIGCAYTCQL